MENSIIDAVNLVLYKMLIKNKSKVRATRETIEELDTPANVIIDALKKVDAHIIKKYSDELYHMVCVNQTQFLTTKTTCLELIDEGFKILKNPGGDADYNILMDDCVTAKLFKHRSDSVKYLYGSSLVTPFPIKFQETSKVNYA